MKILVTGSKGMIGSHLVKGLLEAGYEVVGLDRICNQSCDGRYFHYVLIWQIKIRFSSLWRSISQIELYILLH